MALTVGLKALYHLNGDVRDSSGYGNHGTVVGAVVESDTIKLGSGCYSFDGVDDRISIPPTNSDEMSVAFWFNRSSLDVVNADTVFGGWYYTANAQLQEGFDVGRFYPTANTRMQFVLVTKTTSDVREVKTLSYELGDTTGMWVHCVGTYNKVTGVQKFFVNGVLRSSINHAAGNTIVPLTSYSDMRIGHSRVNNGWFHGLIDEFAIWNRPLSDGGVSVGEIAGDEVALLYNSGFGRELKLMPEGYVPRCVHGAVKAKVVKI